MILKSQTNNILGAVPASIPDAIRILESRGILLIPTETVYGLAVDSESDPAQKHLRELKGRDEHKPFQWLVSDVEDVRRHVCCWNDSLERLAAKYWPGPLTIVLEGIGWRVPDHAFLRELIGSFGRPLSATSANLSGKPASPEFDDALSVFSGKIDLALNGGRGSVGRPSSVVKVTGSKLDILREEAVCRHDLIEAWEHHR